MNFDFENKDEFITEDSEETSAPESFSEFEDISSNSDDSEMDFVSSFSTDFTKKKVNKTRVIINTVTSVILAISILFTTVMGWFLASADGAVTDNFLLTLDIKTIRTY